VKNVSYCPKCGIKLPKEEGIKFCPNCGSLIHLAWSCSLRTRVIVFLAVLFLCFISTILGTLARVNLTEALRIERDVENLRTAIRVVGVQVIFGNNFMYTMIMFVPVIGPGWGFFILYNTGRVIAAIAAINRVNPIFLLSLLFLQMHAWMEYVSYSLAISESLILTYSIIKRSFKNELKNMSVILTICSIILLLAAIIEFAAILYLI